MSVFRVLNEQKKTETSHSSGKLPINHFDKLPIFSREYLLNRKMKNYSMQTLEKYSYDYLLFFQFLIEKSGAEIAVSDITLEDIAELEIGAVEKFVSYLVEERKNGAYAVQRKIGSLSSLFKFYLDKGKLRENPFAQIERGKAPKRETIFLREVELYQLLTEIEGTKTRTAYEEEILLRDIAFISLLAFSGCRISEICQLQLQDLKMERQEIQVIGKGNKQRTVPVHKRALAYVENYLGVVKFRPTLPEHYLFFGLRSKATFHSSITTRTGEKILKKYVEMLEGTFSFLQNKKITPHKLRHTYATVLLENNVDVFTIQELLGHESVATTQLYAHVLDAKKRQAAEVFASE